ncbi:hypothetical protein LCGC14_1896620, partial [marine sediment metagenome]
RHSGGPGPMAGPTASAFAVGLWSLLRGAVSTPVGPDEPTPPAPPEGPPKKSALISS